MSSKPYRHFIALLLVLFCSRFEAQAEDLFAKSNMLDFLRTNYIETSQWIFATYWCNKYGVRIIFYSKEGDFALVGKETKNDIDGVEYDGKASASDNNTLTFWLRSEDDTANPVLQILHLK